MSPLLHAARPILIDLAATFLFYGVLAATGNVTLATALGVALGIAQVAALKLRGMPISGMQWASLGLVVVMGGATLLTKDARFILIKPTIIYAVIGAAMLQRGWMSRYMPPISAGRIPAGLIVGAGYAWAGLMFLSAALNLALALTVDAKTAAGVMAAWSPVSKIVLFAGQYLLFRHIAVRHIRGGAQPAEITA
ncbi:septation protein IspZ [Phenylobacterium sp. LH3H17]|uniref:inner membrane-spanning protein YciB n=1 Tax=Phenylobacterium sp. LH3H17 TaxID=2903901 RepID=UPI0020C95823|nr:septation protein IspZ [Phenylobacterium sp. LH3H17]UTP40700.1 septation protein IspZ [Phenylobacterium sp. LH3H17]